MINVYHAFGAVILAVGRGHFQRCALGRDLVHFAHIVAIRQGSVIENCSQNPNQSNSARWGHQSTESVHQPV